MKLKVSVALALLLGLSGAAHAQSVTLRYGHVFAPDNTNHQLALKFVEIVKEKSNGDIAVKVFPSSSLGTDQQLINLAQAGSIDFAAAGAASFSGLVPDLNALEVPFSFQNSEHAHHVLDGEIGKGLLAQFDGHQLRGMTFSDIGWRALSNSVKPINTPEDVKGLKVRTNNSPYVIKTFEVLGANPTPMAIAEVYTALESRAIDAQENPLPIYVSLKFEEVQKYLTLTNHAFTAGVVVMSKKSFEKLSPEQQKIVSDSMAEAATYQRQAFAEQEKSILEAVRNAGVEVNEKPDMEAFRKLVKPAVDEAFAAKNGKELLEAIEAAK